MRKLVGLFLSMLLLCAMPLSATPGAQRKAVGALYTMTNSAAGNEVLMYPRAADGALGGPVAFSTGGLGATGLGNQGALALTDDEQWLLVVNAGSDTVSVFDVRPGGLRLTDMVDSGGSRPLSITVDRDLVYVLNSGGVVGSADNIAGFRLDSHGHLTYLQGSSRPLSATSTAPAQIRFNPNGRVLVITEKATNSLDTFAVGPDGLPISPTPMTRSRWWTRERASRAPGPSTWRSAMTAETSTRSTPEGRRSASSA